MDTITISKEKYDRMVEQIKLLKELENIDFDLVMQFKRSLEDVKKGKVIRIA